VPGPFNLFFLSEAWRSLERSRFMALIATGSITIALLALGTYFLAVRNAGFLLQGLEERVEMEVYLKDELSTAQAQAALEALRQLPGCREAELVSPDQGLKTLSADPEIRRFLELLGRNPLPTTVRLKTESKDPEFLEAFAARARKVEGVADLSWGREALERLLRVLQVFRLVLATAGVVLSLAAFLIVGNVVRLTVFARREEVSIMKLVGAGNFFVRAPFLLEGCLEGLAGGLLAAGLLQVLGRFVHYQVLTEIYLDLDAVLPYGVDWLFALRLAGLGAGMGFLASLFSVGRYLRA
jgi:cell division transport system permease protein